MTATWLTCTELPQTRAGLGGLGPSGVHDTVGLPDPSTDPGVRGVALCGDLRLHGGWLECMENR